MNKDEKSKTISDIELSLISVISGLDNKLEELDHNLANPRVEGPVRRGGRAEGRPKARPLGRVTLSSTGQRVTLRV